MYQNTQFSLITLYLLQLLENCYVSKEKEMFFISYPHVVNLITFSFTFYNDMFYKSYTLKLSKLALSKQLPDYRYADKKLQQNYLLHFVCPYTSYVDDRYCALSSIQSPLLFSQYPVSYSIILYIFKYSQLSISMQQSCRSMGKYWRNIGQEAVIVNLKLVFAQQQTKQNIILRWLNMFNAHQE